jgi:Zn-dependent protease with chaperone function
MNFFEHQERARRNTVRLILLFVAAVLLIILALYLVGLLAAMYGDVKHEIGGLGGDRAGGVVQPAWRWWRPEVLGWVTVAALVIIGLGSLWKMHSLSGGGAAVAAALGGKMVNPETNDPDERRLLNVVEEMAIASGVAVPLVFVLDDEKGVNAFAAGYSPNDAAVAVTRGALGLLKRDELQGVMAHEFSHILNGDMRLNIRLIGILHGILVIGILGTLLMRSLAFSGRSSSRRGGGGAAAIFAVGAMLAIIGYVGVFFGRLIKAAASRQREFLADASAVDFTRDPDGVAGALKKIGGCSARSTILSPAAEEASHMFFGNALGKALLFGGAMATHPPLTERIRRIDPAFDGKFPKVAAPARKGRPPQRAPGLQDVVSGFRAAGTVTADPRRVVEQVGAPTIDHLVHGAALIAAMPETVRAAAHEPVGAIAVVYALLLDEEEAERERQFGILRTYCEPVFVEETSRLLPLVAGLDPALRLPLVDLAVPALRGLSSEQYQRFRRNVKLLVEADRKISIFEFALQKVLFHRLAASFEKAGRKGTQYWAFTPLVNDCLVVLSILGRVGQRDAAAAKRAFDAGVARLPRTGKRPPSILPVEACSFHVLDKALDRLASASPVIKEATVDACGRCVLADGTVTVKEAELLRAVSDTLDCPLPPFLPAAAKTADEGRD